MNGSQLNMVMKIIISSLLVTVTLLMILSGCAEETNKAGEISDYDSQAFVPVGNTSGASPENSENATQADGFVVSDKLYDFGENNLVVLNVENKTSKDYSITIKGTYLDEDGKILKEETKTFTGFAAGWKNNFFFMPNISFARFAYTLHAEEFVAEELVGECYASSIGLTHVYKIEKVEGQLEFLKYQAALEEWTENGEIGDPPLWDDYKRWAMVLDIREEYESEELLVLTQGFLVLSESGTILAAPHVQQTLLPPGKEQGDGWRTVDLQYAEKDSSEFDPEWDGNLTLLISITEVRLYDPALDDPKF